MGPPLAAVIGGGPGGLMAAEVLASSGLKVVVFEQMPSVGRKLLVAGRGGLNLTHSEPLDRFLQRYDWTGSDIGSASAGPSLIDAIGRFPPSDLRDWSAGLGHETFVGSSGRVFPKGLRANGLLASWLERLQGLGVEIRTRTKFLGWDGDRLRFHSDAPGRDATGEYFFVPDVTVMSLGGASWPKVGSDGSWQQTLREKGVKVTELSASNCGFKLPWSKVFRDRFEGSPVKNIAVTARPGESRRDLGEITSHGEFMIVNSGIEGGVVYAVGSRLRSQLADAGTAELLVDLRPDLDLTSIVERLERRRPKESTSTALKRLVGLDAVKIGLINEVTRQATPTRGSTVQGDGPPREAHQLAGLIKALPLTLTGSEGLDRA
ncbi:MAG: TIGR03862 family flavoprotein, partial [Microthrixaceae bacterium]